MQESIIYFLSNMSYEMAALCFDLLVCFTMLAILPNV